MGKKNITSWDVETTGLDKVHDRIIQISAIKLDGETLEEIGSFNSYVIPEGNDWHIDANASEVNGLTDEMIREKGRPAREVFKEFLDFIEDDNFLTYNGNTFDVEFTFRDMAELGLQFPIEGRVFFDSKFMETKLRSNRLIHVFERYTGKTMEESGLNPHDSLSDARATAEVFRQQLKQNNLNLEEVSQWDENQMWSPEGSIKNAAHVGNKPLLVFKNGKYRDKDIYSVTVDDPNYLKWWAEKIATSYTKEKVRKYLMERKAQEGK